MAAAAVGGILLASVTLYAVLGGADFGGGLWDLLAGGDRRGRAPRALIEESITPVWGGQPRLADLRPSHLLDRVPARVRRGDDHGRAAAVAGRGRDRAARGRVRLPQGSLPAAQQRAADATFAFSSLLTPFFMDTVVGAIASGRYPPMLTTPACRPGLALHRC